MKKTTTLATVSVAFAVTAMGLSIVTAPAAHADNRCSKGGNYKMGETRLTNGLLRSSTCWYSNGRPAMVDNVYFKYEGTSAATVRFGWQFVSKAGTNAQSPKWDNGRFTIYGGQTRSFRWVFNSPGPITTHTNATCVRGVLRQFTGNGSVDFSTRVMCP